MSSASVESRLLLNAQTAADALSISTRKLWELTNRGEIPVIRIGRGVRYAPKDLEAWVAKQRKGSS